MSQDHHSQRSALDRLIAQLPLAEQAGASPILARLGDPNSPVFLIYAENFERLERAELAMAEQFAQLDQKLMARLEMADKATRENVKTEISAHIGKQTRLIDALDKSKTWRRILLTHLFGAALTLVCSLIASTYAVYSLITPLREGIAKEQVMISEQHETLRRIDEHPAALVAYSRFTRDAAAYMNDIARLLAPFGAILREKGITTKMMDGAVYVGGDTVETRTINNKTWVRIGSDIPPIDIEDPIQKSLREAEEAKRKLESK